MDNRIFDVNGKGSDLLLLTLQLAFKQSGNEVCKAWRQTPENGLVLEWWEKEGNNPLPSPLTAEQCLPIAENWLSGDFAKKVQPDARCVDLKHDGHNSLGWQVYCEEWGHVGGEHTAICAIRPAFIWHGK